MQETMQIQKQREKLREDCIFCKIVRGEIPSQKVYENKKVLAFLDIGPVNKGHTLVISKEHYKNIYDTPEGVLCDVMKAVKLVARGVKEAVSADGINVGISNERAAGQAVFHLHFHVMPRFEGDGLRLFPQGSYAEKEAEKVVESVRKSIKSLL